ncbi:MAG: hypothetical protein IJ213_01065 [Bacteroidales bacterium]|nr:hypothetical protein [Bacteroidales bacterium]
MNRKKGDVANRIDIEDGSLLKLLEDPNIKEAFLNFIGRENGRENALKKTKVKKKKYTTEEYNIYDCLIYPRKEEDNTEIFNELLRELKAKKFLKEKITGKKNGKYITTLYWCGTKKSFAMFCYVVAQNLFYSHKKQPYSYFIALIKDNKGKDFDPASLSKYKGEYIVDVKLERILVDKLEKVCKDCLKCLDK